MPRIVLKLIVGLIAVALLLIGALAVALPRLINSDEFRTTLRESASEALGTPVEWQSLDVRLLPLRLTISEPVLAAATRNPEEASLTAESVDLRLALLPIFSRRVQVDSLVLHGVELVVTRTPEGFLLPVEQDEKDSDVTNPDDRATVTVDDAQESGAFELALHRIVISESRIIIRDRTLSRPIEWRLEDLEFEVFAAEGGATGEPLAVELAANLRSGASEVGRIQTAGTVSLTGLYDLDIEVENLLIAEFQPYVSDTPDSAASGVVSGRVRVNGATSTLSEIDLDLRIDQLVVQSSGIDLAGGLTIRASQALGDPVTFSAVLDLETGGQAEITGSAALEGEGPIRLEAGLEFSNGGRLDVEGTSTPAGLLDIRAQMESLDLAIMKPLLPDPKMELSGLASGQARIVGEAASPEFISLDVAVESGLLRVPDYLVEGPFRATFEIKHPLSARPRGQIALDLTAARLEYQDQFKKPAGTRAEMTTKFAPEESGEIVFESRIKLRDINEILLQGAVSVQGAISDSTSVSLTTSSFDLEGWSGLLPVLEPYRLDGIVRFEGISATWGEDSPSRFGGRIAFEKVELSVPNAGRLRIRGAIVGDGPRIRTKGLRVLMGSMTVGINGSVEDPLNEARFELDVKSIGAAEVNDLLSALTSTRDTVFGNLKFAGEVKGVASSEADLYSSLEGDFEFSIGEDEGGRLRGVSILRTILDQVPLLGGAARLTQPFRGGRSVDDYFTEDFEIIEGDFEIGQGQVNAKLLRLAYEGYEVELTGPIRLRDLTIDMTGEVLLKEDLVSALGGHVGRDGAKQPDREPIRIPLSHVTNTLAEPKIEMTSDTLAALPKLILQGTGLDALAVDVGRALGRFLGGGDD
jgi:hypothetical protein